MRSSNVEITRLTCVVPSHQRSYGIRWCARSESNYASLYKLNSPDTLLAVNIKFQPATRVVNHHFNPNKLRIRWQYYQRTDREALNLLLARGTFINFQMAQFSGGTCGRFSTHEFTRKQLKKKK
ncbi:hypothetical protein PUN28_009655 [Cardiocondyla obscurior]|uniref:Uncharacterized protein n=1 Tax=Cardiocondyla obscurior TaxID=286306 RepID=A0AAW2FTC7_9HYME